MERPDYKRIALLSGLLLFASAASANDRDQARRMYDRIVGSPPSEAVLDTLESLVSGGQVREAALQATDQDGFYNVTLKNMVTPWTNEAQDVFCLLYTSPSPRDLSTSRMPSSA